MFGCFELRLEIFDFDLIRLRYFSQFLYPEVEAVILFLLFFDTFRLLVYRLAVA